MSDLKTELKAILLRHEGKEDLTNILIRGKVLTKVRYG